MTAYQTSDGTGSTVFHTCTVEPRNLKSPCLDQKRFALSGKASVCLSLTRLDCLRRTIMSDPSGCCVVPKHKDDWIHIASKHAPYLHKPLRSAFK